MHAWLQIFRYNKGWLAGLAAFKVQSKQAWLSFTKHNILTYCLSNSIFQQLQ